MLPCVTLCPLIKKYPKICKKSWQLRGLNKSKRNIDKNSNDPVYKLMDCMYQKSTIKLSEYFLEVSEKLKNQFYEKLCL